MKVNKVVIAAAGEGTRMLHLTTNKSKHLINVRKKPFLSYLLDNLFLAGYRDLILVVGYKEELIGEFLNKYSPPLKSLRKSQYNIEMVSQYDMLGSKKEMYGTACPLMCVEKSVKKNHFVYLNGDNLYSVRDLKLMNINGKYNYIAGIYHKNPHKYGVLVSEKGFLKEIIEKSNKFVGNIINIGLYKFTPEVFEKLKGLKKSSRGEYEITDVINMLARAKKVKVCRVKDFWLDFGNPADIIRLSYFLKSIKKFTKLFGRHSGFHVLRSGSRDLAKKVKEFLGRGQVVVSPTDTLYGLIADATNDQAVERIFNIKQRDKSKPITIFVNSIAEAKKLAIIDEKQEDFLGEVWPGKITVVLKRKQRSGLSKKLFGKKETIALRIPDHKIISEILSKFKKPLTGTSANLSGKGSITKISDIIDQFNGQEAKPDLIIDAGNLPASSSSIIIDLTKKKPEILRP